MGFYMSVSFLDVQHRYISLLKRCREGATKESIRRLQIDSASVSLNDLELKRAIGLFNIVILYVMKTDDVSQALRRVEAGYAKFQKDFGRHNISQDKRVNSRKESARLSRREKVKSYRLFQACKRRGIPLGDDVSMSYFDGIPPEVIPLPSAEMVEDERLVQSFQAFGLGLVQG
jgi:hypothetical protein